MSFEDLLEEVGSFGLYQRLLCFIIIPITTGLCGFTFYAQIFILEAAPHICKGNLASSQNFSTSIAENSWINTSSYEEKMACNKRMGLFDSETVPRGAENSTAWEPCTEGWSYNYDALYPTLASENDWVCDDAWKPYIIVTSFWVGNTVGAWLFGIISDMYGRRPAIAASFILYSVSGLASAFVEHFWGFLFLRILVGSAHHTVSHLPFVFVIEHCGLKSRVIPLFAIMMSYTIASMITPMMAYVIWSWKTLTLVCSLPAFVFALFYKWLPESPSWMMTKNRRDEALHQLQVISRINGCEKTFEELKELQERLEKVEDSSFKRNVQETNGRENEKQSIIQVLKFPQLRKNIFLVLILWMLGCFCYFGHCLNTSHLGSNLFMSYFLGALVEVPAWGAPWLINKLGRKIPLITALFSSGVTGLIYAFLPVEYVQLSLGFALIGRLTITMAYYITLQYGPEIFPTVIRGQGIALSETLGGVAIFISPLIVYLGESSTSLPMTIFSVLSLVGAALAFLLPETAGATLPQTFLEAENFSRRKAQAKTKNCDTEEHNEEQMS